jgi:hypothetical protein
MWIYQATTIRDPDIMVLRACRYLEHYKPPYDATAVLRLKAAGAIIIGKTNCDEFGMGSTTENSAYQKTKNAWSAEHVPGIYLALHACMQPLVVGAENCCPCNGHIATTVPIIASIVTMMPITVAVYYGGVLTIPRVSVSANNGNQMRVPFAQEDHQAAAEPPLQAAWCLFL